MTKITRAEVASLMTTCYRLHRDRKPGVMVSVADAHKEDFGIERSPATIRYMMFRFGKMSLQELDMYFEDRAGWREKYAPKDELTTEQHMARELAREDEPDCWNPIN